MMRVVDIVRRSMCETRGNTLVIFGLSIPLIFGTAGLAVDFSRAQSARAAAQATMDAALLAAARKADIDDAGVQAIVDSYFAAANVLKSNSTMVTLEGKLTDTATFEGTGNLRMPTTLLNVVGISVFDMEIKSKVSRGLGTGNVEIALVLDTTKSMEGTRLDNVKTAGRELIDTIYALPNATNKIKVSLVPFAQYVNVGMNNRNAPWMDVPSDTTTTTISCYDSYPNAVKSNCRMVTYTGYNDGIPYTYQSEECDWNWGAAVNTCGPVTNSYTWNGCAGARANSLNVKDDEYSSRIPGIRNVYCPSPITPLTHNATMIKDNINAMYAQGETYIPTGLTWGWRTLSNRAPFTESGDDPATAGGQVRKYLVLMTDGYNTKSPRFPEADHEGSDTSAANASTRAACDNVKADIDSKIEIFTIAFQVNDETVKDILRYCATPGGAFFDAVDYSKLMAAFGEIGNSLSVARLAN